MPNYLYKCERCDEVIDISLPMSSDPKETLNHPAHKNVCLGRYKRIMRAFGCVKGLKVFAGDWFKKTYGHEIGERSTTKAEFQADLKKAEDKHKRETGC